MLSRRSAFASARKELLFSVGITTIIFLMRLVSRVGTCALAVQPAQRVLDMGHFEHLHLRNRL